MSARFCRLHILTVDSSNQGSLTPGAEPAFDWEPSSTALIAEQEDTLALSDMSESLQAQLQQSLRTGGVDNDGTAESDSSLLEVHAEHLNEAPSFAGTPFVYCSCNTYVSNPHGMCDTIYGVPPYMQSA